MKLGKEPLIDAIFEMRFQSQEGASNILAGVLYTALSGEKKIEHLPTASLPQQLRDIDPNLQFAPVIRIIFDKFSVSIGDKSFVIGCSMPYPGWKVFKKNVMEVVTATQAPCIIQSINRFSLKYTDIIPTNNHNDSSTLLNADLSIGGHSFLSGNYSLRVEKQDNDLLHILSIISHATATTRDGAIRNGLVVDVDTIAGIADEPMQNFVSNLPSRLEHAHLANKSTFFKCLTESTIQRLEPAYA